MPDKRTNRDEVRRKNNIIQCYSITMTGGIFLSLLMRMATFTATSVLFALVKRFKSQFVYLEKFRLSFTTLMFVIRVNLLHP